MERIRSSAVQITPPQSPEDRLIEVQEGERSGRRRVKANRTKAYREIQRLKEELKKKIKTAGKYRKKYKLLLDTHNSPRKHLRIQLKGHKVKQNIQRELLFNSVIVQGIRNKMKKLNTEKDKQVLSKVISRDLLKKYILSHLAIGP